MSNPLPRPTTFIICDSFAAYDRLGRQLPHDQIGNKTKFIQANASYSFRDLTPTIQDTILARNLQPMAPRLITAITECINKGIRLL